MGKPVIAITGPEKGAFGPRSLVALMVRWYGGTPLQLRPSQHARLSHMVFDGVVVTGGHDIDPVLYAAEPEVVPKYDTARDTLESAVIDHALNRGIPLLGICRGAQLLNACLGGSLHQDIQRRRRRTSNRRTLLPLKTLILEQPGLLSRLLGTGPCRINSLHNQAIDRVGMGLQVVARDLDGIVQAIEDPHQRYLLGVQWHPEFLIFMSRQRRLFQDLLQACREAQ
ncbi:Glutamine amidotransferase, class I [Nitrincola lacisaponensis]|uniref:Glutamine amidotransferase, class I n=1 Tax=Nitrincola lacisaponensis TaxID=267850 RepID=A0A063Y2J4_9GAMM|nr:gamma-glutamyl-gamma-aminobutyrate hydrolase family protein [Nitrincola lacisaponensis]KDE38951.1 Glutamine amidotransferase, class I [Nitrincola lacisaponensis]